MEPKINRRDFLKLALSLPLLNLVSYRPLASLGDPGVASRPPNILILVFDALSARNLPFHGYPRQTTPNLARLAERATVYHTHHSGGNFTTPGTASIFTGTYPWSHRALHLHGTMLETYGQRNIFSLAAPGYYRLGYSHNLLVTSLMHQMRADLEKLMFTRELILADMEYSDRVFPEDFNVSFWSESLILRGYSTKASSLFISQLYHLWEGLRERALERKYAGQFPLGVPTINGLYWILEEGIDWCIDQLGKLPQPYLAYIHFYPPHHPYYPRLDFIDHFKDDYVPARKPRHRFSEKGVTPKYLNQQRKAYDEYLAYADSEFGRLYDHLLGSELLENTYLIFTSDHGEMFERGIWGHGTRTLYEPLVHVPLLISKPGQAERQDIFTPTSNVDLLPTLMSLMGQPIPNWSEGEILPGFSPSPSDGERSIYVMEAKQNAQRAPLKIGTFALFKGPYKLIHYRGYEDYKGERDELYNLANDPEEMEDRFEAEKSLAMELEEELDARIEEANRPFEKG